jgi:hypothetical protein
MRAYIVVLCSVIFLLNAYPISRITFNDYFFDETMRVDYHHMGNAEDEFISIDRIYRYGIWAGRLENLIDSINSGKFSVKIYDHDTGNLIYSKGFDSYFGEYQTTSDALEGTMKTYHETALIPYPKNKIRFSIEKRDIKNELLEIFSTEIDPNSLGIVRDKIVDSSIKVFKNKNNGNPHTRVDIAILGEGYKIKDIDKFQNDFEKFTNIFFSFEPYKSYKDKFNFYGILKPSEESGVDEPRAGIFKKTALGLTFNSLGSERYLLTEDNKSVRDIASHVPYDALVIMVNHNRYGGGGIYNLFATFTSDNQWQGYLLLHEFGHSFSGLADEYYTSDVAYNEFFSVDVEPVEPNITALINNEVKWRGLLSDGIETPTLWEKDRFDSLDLKWQAERRTVNDKIADLKKNKMSESEILKAQEEYALRDKEHSEEVDNFLRNSRFWGKVGAFEGAGYQSRGLFRPMIDCLMFSKGKKPFCKVCESAVIRMINNYAE